MSLETFDVIEAKATTWDEISDYTWDSLNVVVNNGTVLIQSDFLLSTSPVLGLINSCDITGQQDVSCAPVLVLVSSCTITEEVIILFNPDVFETYFTEVMLSYFPHRWLDPKAPGVNRLIGGIGKTFGRWHPDYIGNIKAQQSVASAGEGLYYWENQLGIKPNPLLPLETRRANVLARMMNRGGPFTKHLLEQALLSYGATVEVTQDPANYTVTVKVLEPRGTPQFLAEMQEYTREVVHAHLGIEWELSFITWDELRWTTFNDIEALTFDELEVF